MTALEKAARVLKRKLNESGYLDYEEAVRAVIASIEVDDAMVVQGMVAALSEAEGYLSRLGPNERSAVRIALGNGKIFTTALTASLRSLLEVETGK